MSERAAVSTDNPPHDAGLLMVDENRVAHWYSERVGAVSPVEVALADGCAVTVDPAAPEIPLGWRVSSAAGAAELSETVGDTDLAAAIERTRTEPGGRLVLPARVLPPRWAHVALVESVGRWTMRPIHRGALLVDRAVAAAGVGRTRAARTLFVLAQDVLADLGERCRDGEMPGAVGDLVAEAMRAAIRLDVAGPGFVLPEEGAAAPGDDVLRRHTERWRGAATAGTEVRTDPLDAGDPDPTVGHAMVDIHALAPRVVSWRGAHRYELSIRHHLGDGTFVVTAALATGADPLGREVGELIAYAADRGSGRLVATAPLRLSGRALVARLPAGARTIAGLRFGLASVGTDLAELRTDPVGRSLAAVDRLMVEAWSEQRAAQATVHTVSATAPEAVLRRTQADHRARLRSALRSAVAARKVLERQLISARGTDADTAALRTLLLGRLDAVTGFMDTLDTRTSGRPVLTELVAPDGDS